MIFLSKMSKYWGLSQKKLATQWLATWGEKEWKQVKLSEVKDRLSYYVRQAATEEVVITRHGRPAGILIGFQSDDDWFDYRLENDPRFLARIAKARRSLREGKGIRLEELAF